MNDGYRNLPAITQQATLSTDGASQAQPLPAMVRNGQPGEKHKRIFYGLHLIDRYAEWKSGGAKGCLAIDPRGDIHGKGEL
jgi:hypothetical protein